MSDINGLKKQRSVNKGRLTYLLNSIKKGPAELSIEECRAKLNRAEKLMEEFTIIENNIFDIDQEQEPDMEYEENYYKAVTQLNTLIHQLGIDNGNTSFDHNLNTTSAIAQVRLPKLNIPLFSGDYTEWQSFHDLFVTSIHDSPSLSPVQKLQYLKGLLRGEAASLIRHFSITEANYIEALQKLRQRYDRKRHMMTAFIRTFIDQPAISTANNTNVKKLLDTSDEVLRGLKAMGPHGEDRDPWLLFILVNKLDDESKGLWARETADQEFPKVKDFFDFLLQRSDALDSLRVPVRRGSNSNNKPQPIKSHVAVDGIKCSVCQSDGHAIYQCPVFNGMEIAKRREMVKENKRCFNCLSDKHPVFRCPSRRRCFVCKKKHHTLVHVAEIVPNESNDESNANCTNAIRSDTSERKWAQSILPTTLTEVISSSGRKIQCRALLDSGSQVSFITESCLQRLGLPRQNGRVAIKGVGKIEAGITKGIVTINIKPPSGSNLSVKAYVLKHITKVPQIDVEYLPLKQWSHLTLADPEFFKSNEIDLLIGVDQFFNILIDGRIKGQGNHPILQNTIFGWVVAGTLLDRSTNSDDSILCGTSSLSECNIDATLKRFWELESILNDVRTLSPEENLCENHFAENLQRLPDGRFQVRLPFKDSTTKLGNSMSMAIQRLKGMERRFTRDIEFKNLYTQFMHEYLSLGHMQEIPQTMVKDGGFFLPHHGVLKKDSLRPKIRVVFDGSAKTSSGLSLNDCLSVGATVQSTLYSIILRFREHRVVFSADIEKMYRQVRIHDDDTKFQQIVWRDQPTDPIRYFRLCTVTYGLASAPFLATRALKQIADENVESNEIAAKRIERDIYVDDLMTGGDKIDEVKQLKESIQTILSNYGLTLRKWVSNSPEVLKDVPPEDRLQQNKSVEESVTDETVKILGLQYHPNEDIFKFRVVPPVNQKLTKRTILSDAGRLFDPLGWIAPITIKIKIFIQQLWLLNLSWDDPLPQKEATEWELMRATLIDLEELAIPRFVQTDKQSTVQLHGFCDASTLAYAAVVFYKVRTSTGEIYTHLLSAKTKVAPLKQQSLPRLELCGAVLLTDLMNQVKKETQTVIQDVVLWTDSTIVLDWLTAHPRRWPTFVANRTSHILSSFGRQHWRHVPTSQNPADSATRGLYPHEMKSSELWWTGPKWLKESSECWPQQQVQYATNDPLAEHLVYTTTVEYDIFESLIAKCSSFHKLQRIVAYCLRFIRAYCSRKEGTVKGNALFLTREELYEALFKICKYEQKKYYPQELTDLQHSKLVKHTSNLKSLSPFIDDSGVLRVGGRLEKYDAPFSTRHPIILSSKSRVTALIIEEMHRQNKHAGPSLLLALSRQQYWIPGAKNLIRQIVHKCVTCTRHKAATETQLMGNLPSYRLELVRPFLKVGLDYAGPLSIHLTKGRGQKTYKAYICLFVCLSTKAVHLELVSDLSSDAFLAALKRFVARRGCCQEIYSDNGSNFIGANNQLQQSFKHCIENSNEISHFISRNTINWHFIPPSAPHFGGIWESAIKSTKFHLHRVVGDSILTLEEMNTLLTEIESILNSRPLCVLSTEDIDALTPSHFLLGHPATKLPEPDVSQFKPSHLSRWQMIQYMSQHFWRRWHLEYLTSLQQKSKWLTSSSSVNLNDIVIIKDENLPTNKWLLGKIIALHPGTDGLTRVVTMKTKNGELKRPVTKIVKLHFDHDWSKPAECSYTSV